MVSRLNSSSPRATQPTNTDVKLKDHQLALLYHAMRLEDDIMLRNAVTRRNNDRGQKEAERRGIKYVPTVNEIPAIAALTDKAGAGKTFVAISLVCKDIEKKKQGCTVVVVPQTILAQWKAAVKEFAPNMKCAVVQDYMSASALMYGDTSILKDNQLVIVDSLYCDTLASVVQTSGTTLHRVIYDEVDTIEVVLRRILPANMIWMISASLYALLKDSPPDSNGVTTPTLYANAYQVPRKVLEKVECICEQSFIESCFPLPDPIGEIIEVDDMYLDKVMADTMDKKTLYDANNYDYINLLKGFETLAVHSSKQALCALVRGLTQKIQAYEDMIDLYNKRGPDDKVAQNSKKRVQNTMDEAQRRLNILHNAIQAAKICPVCIDGGIPQTDDKCTKCGKSSDKSLHDDTCLGKVSSAVAKVAELLLWNEDSKILIFSDGEYMLGLLEVELIRRDMSCKTMSAGNADEIAQDIDDFKNSKYSCMLLDSSSFTSGLNLEMTTDIICMHKLELGTRAQLIGRAQRPGRIGTLTVHDILHENERR
jgi:SNF2 family DNA or RNA helicase